MLYTEYDAADNSVTTGNAECTVTYTERKDAELVGSATHATASR